MWQYLVKRLLLLLVTLFGIALISFLIVTLAPGDPASMKVAMKGRGQGGVSDLTIRKNRELYFLDRPRVLNFDPPTRRTAVSKALTELDARAELERKDAELQLMSAIGTSGLDVLLEVLPQRAKVAAEGRAALETRLDALAAATTDAARSAALEDLVTHHAAFAPPITLSDGRLPSAAERATTWVRQRKALVVEAEAPARRVLKVLTSVVPPEAGGPTLAEDAPVADAVAAWTAWWQAHAGDYSAEKAAEATREWLARGDVAAVQTEGVGAAPLLAALKRVGQPTAPALMDAFEDAAEGSKAEQLAAYGLAVVCKKPWDLTTTPDERQTYASRWKEKRDALDAAKQEAEEEEAAEKKAAEAQAAADANLTPDERAAAKKKADEAEAAPEKKIRMHPAAYAREVAALGTEEEFVRREEQKEFEDHRDRWADWWYRAEENYVDFGGGRQLQRAFTQTQFGRWMSRFVKLDFGESYKTKRPVSEMIKERIGKTLTLNLISLFLCYLVAIPLGIYSAVHKDTLTDRVTTLVLFVLYSLPSFWVGSMLILGFTGEDWLLSGLTGVAGLPSHHFSSLDAEKLSTTQQWWDIAKHILLPVICLTYIELAYVSRLMRTGLLDVIRQDYIRTARAKGLPERVVIYKHALRNGLIPILTLMGSLLPVMFGGSVIIESIFSIDGLGKMAFDAILDRDYPVIMANLVISGFLTLFGILMADIAYAVVDPRIEFR